MSKKDLITLFIKLTGASIFISYFFSFTAILINLIGKDVNHLQYEIQEIKLYCLLLLLAILLMVYGEKMVSLFRLNKGFDSDSISLDNLTTLDIASLGLFIIGALLIVETAPYLLVGIYQRFAADIANSSFLLYDNYLLGQAAIKLVLGYLLVTNNKKIGKCFI